MQDWPDTWWGYRDDTKWCGHDVVVQGNWHPDELDKDLGFAAYLSEPTTDEMSLSYAEFEITTDPAEAPADALLEQAGIEYDAVFAATPGEVGGAILLNDMRVYTREHLAWQWTEHIPSETWAITTSAMVTPCHNCKGTGRVHGMILPNAWACDVCDGKGVV